MLYRLALSVKSYNVQRALRQSPANGFELSGPANSSSHFRAELAGSVEDPGVLPGLQRVVRQPTPRGSVDSRWRKQSAFNRASAASVLSLSDASAQ